MRSLAGRPIRSDGALRLCPFSGVAAGQAVLLLFAGRFCPDRRRPRLGDPS